MSASMMRKGLRIFDTRQRMLSPQECFQVVTENGTNTILLVPQNELVIDDKPLDSTPGIYTDAGSHKKVKDIGGRFHSTL
jgi:hypothetical protein